VESKPAIPARRQAAFHGVFTDSTGSPHALPNTNASDGCTDASAQSSFRRLVHQGAAEGRSWCVSGGGVWLGRRCRQGRRGRLSHRRSVIRLDATLGHFYTPAKPNSCHLKGSL
jgi:hypothetical protein